MPLQTWCSAIDLSSRVPLGHVKSAGVDSTSAAERRSFGGTTFHNVGSLDRPDHAEPPVEVYDDVA